MFWLLDIWNLFSKTSGFFFDIFEIIRNLSYIFSLFS